MKYVRIKVNENLTSIINYIHSCDKKLSYYDLITFCIDFQYYEELFISYKIIKDLLEEHNQKFKL